MKRTSFRKTMIVLGVLALLGAAGVAGANPAERSWGYPGQEQSAQAQEMIAAHHAAVAPLMQQLYAKQAELDAQLYGGAPDAAAIEKLSRDIGALQGQLYAASASLTARLAKEGIPAGYWQNGQGMQGMQGMGHGRGWRGGHGGRHGGGWGGGWGGGHGGGCWW